MATIDSVTKVVDALQLFRQESRDASGHAPSDEEITAIAEHLAKDENVVNLIDAARLHNATIKGKSSSVVPTSECILSSFAYLHMNMMLC